jgi:predicted transcriptional regulator
MHRMKILSVFILLVLCKLPISSQTILPDTLYWSENYQLSWKDFACNNVDESRISEQVLMSVIPENKKNGPNAPLVKTFMDRRNCCVPKEARNEHQLKYYQTMFNMHEVCGRNLRKQLSETKWSASAAAEFQENYKEAVKSLSERCKQYMNDTDFGEEDDVVEKWTKTVNAELKELHLFISQ